MYYYVWIDNGYSYDDNVHECIGIFNSKLLADDFVKDYCIQAFLSHRNLYRDATWAILAGDINCYIPHPDDDNLWHSVLEFKE